MCGSGLYNSGGNCLRGTTIQRDSHSDNKSNTYDKMTTPMKNHTMFELVNIAERTLKYNQGHFGLDVARHSAIRGLILANCALPSGILHGSRRFNPAYLKWKAWNSTDSYDNENNCFPAPSVSVDPDMDDETYKAFMDGYHSGRLWSHEHDDLKNEIPGIVWEDMDTLRARMDDCASAVAFAEALMCRDKEVALDKRCIPIAGLALALRALVNVIKYPEREINAAQIAFEAWKATPDWHKVQGNAYARISDRLKDLKDEDYKRLSLGFKKGSSIDGATMEALKDVLDMSEDSNPFTEDPRLTGIRASFDARGTKRKEPEPEPEVLVLDDDDDDDDEEEEEKEPPQKRSRTPKAPSADVVAKYFWNGKDMRHVRGVVLVSDPNGAWTFARNLQSQDDVVSLLHDARKQARENENDLSDVTIKELGSELRLKGKLVPIFPQSVTVRMGNTFLDDSLWPGYLKAETRGQTLAKVHQLEERARDLAADDVHVTPVFTALGSH